MLEGMFVTITGFHHYQDKDPFSIGKTLLCLKEPENPYDTEAIMVVDDGGCKVGYLANSTNTKANGTMSAARLYDRVGDYFLIEVCFSTKSSVICRVTNPNLQDTAMINWFSDETNSDKTVYM